MVAMTLENITVGVQSKPLRIVLYGVDGIGKSTWAANSPAPIFLCAEDGTSFLNVARLPAPDSWADVEEAIGLLYHLQHPYQTLVVDTIDWAEDLARRSVCAEHEVDGIEGLGYGKGYTYTAEKMVGFLRMLDSLVMHKRMNIILLGHSSVEKFNDPEKESYDRYQLRLHKSIEPKFRDWPDAILFANYDTELVKEDLGFKKDRKIATSRGLRIVHTERSAAFDAKNRFPGMPAQLPLDYAAFAEAVAKSMARMSGQG